MRFWGRNSDVVEPELPFQQRDLGLLRSLIVSEQVRLRRVRESVAELEARREKLAAEIAAQVALVVEDLQVLPLAELRKRLAARGWELTSPRQEPPLYVVVDAATRRSVSVTGRSAHDLVARINEFEARRARRVAE